MQDLVDQTDDSVVLTVKEQRRQHIVHVLLDIAIFVIIFCAVLLFFRHYKFPQISGESMSPTFHDGDHVIAEAATDANIGDIIVMWNDRLDEYIVKRVVGIAGDHIVINNGKLYRNGTYAYESYIAEQDWGESGIVYDVVVPANCIFVLGDNRNESTDSRVLGPISCDDIHMRVISDASWIYKFG